MANNLKEEAEVKEFLDKLGIEYRFGCYHEKKIDVCHLLGDYLESIKKDFEKAAKVYKTNCDEQKFAKSCYKYATYSFLGKGKVPKDQKAAYSYYDRGCEYGDTDSCLYAGLMCITSNAKSTKIRDFPMGLKHLQKACTGSPYCPMLRCPSRASSSPQRLNSPEDDARVGHRNVGGNAFSCHYISGMYLAGAQSPTGTEELPKDMKKAHQYATEACKLGNPHACANLSLMYKNGEGVDKDEAKAEHFKKIALEIHEEAAKQQRQLTFQEGIPGIPNAKGA